MTTCAADPRSPAPRSRSASRTRRPRSDSSASPARSVASRRCATGGRSSLASTPTPTTSTHDARGRRRGRAGQQAGHGAPLPAAAAHAAAALRGGDPRRVQAGLPQEAGARDGQEAPRNASRAYSTVGQDPRSGEVYFAAGDALVLLTCRCACLSVRANNFYYTSLNNVHEHAPTRRTTRYTRP